MPPLCQQCQDATIQALEAMGGSATRTEIRRWVIEHGDIDHAAPLGHVDHHLRWSLAWLRKQGEIVSAPYGRWAMRDSTSAAATAPSRTIDHPPSRS
jgi:hypothetical protein